MAHLECFMLPQNLQHAYRNFSEQLGKAANRRRGSDVSEHVWINVNDKVVAFDCDDTLVMWEGNEWEPGPHRVEFDLPISLLANGEIIKTDKVYLVPHIKHIQKLKGYAQSGWFVIVWSAGGGPWAQNVVKTLGLERYVKLITGKPAICFDDIPLNEALGERRYYQDRKKKDEQK